MNIKFDRFSFASAVCALLVVCAPAVMATDVADGPLYTSRTVTPLNMLVLGRDHKLYYEAYNDAVDLSGDGILDIRFKPSISYFGYFDSAKCYNYSGGIFVPGNLAAAALPAGRCVDAGSAQWSGNFLNYVTTSRIDALRKVLYGGKRSVDLADNPVVASQTVLERSFTPQDGHSWGKEYTSVSVDGYDISDYTPLTQPIAATRHLFANTSLSTDVANPLMRVMTNSPYRIWEWVSIEAPIAGAKCVNQSTNCIGSGGADGSHPNNAAEFSVLVEKYISQVISANNALTVINKTANGATSNVVPSVGVGQQDNYVSVITGKLRTGAAGVYKFAISGDDAVDFSIAGVTVGHYGGHGQRSDDVAREAANTLDVTLLASTEYDIVFRHEEVAGGDNYRLAWLPPGGSWAVVPSVNFINLKLNVYNRVLPVSVLTDYSVRVSVCNLGLLEDNCTRYTRPDGTAIVESYKPEGILQDYGFAASGSVPKMRFGLISGSYTNNLRGGVLRRAITNISDEVNAATGQFSAVNGVIGTIDKLKIHGYDGSRYTGCGLITGPINNGICNDWGNPIAEMMYEATRYFAGKSVATTSFDYASPAVIDTTALGLPKAAWDNPYLAAGVESCSAPVQTVISDINPSYDTDMLPGSNWTPGSTDLTGLDVGALGDAIWAADTSLGGEKNIYIGEAKGVISQGPTAKAANSFKTTRGLAPEEPTKQGGYYAASVAYFGKKTDLSTASGAQNMSTYSIALASPLPQFKINLGSNVVTLVPFAKSVKHGSNAGFQTNPPTNTIVDFYVETISDDGRSGTFRVNFEDVEQGNDHDMDAIVRYTYVVNFDDTLTITLSSDYAAGGVVQHMGYVISGTTRDGVYLEVRDADTAVGMANDFAYNLDTLPGFWAGEARGSGQLPLTATRTFSPSSTVAATLLKDPLWYAAKWGGFTDKNANGLPDIKEEWTTSLATDPDPDNYFLVTNALNLRAQLDKAFDNILKTLSSSSAAAASTGQFIAGSSQVIQARFRSDNWSGELVSFEILSSGAIGGILWNSSERVPTAAVRKVYTTNSDSGIGAAFSWAGISTAQQDLLRNDGASGLLASSVGAARLDYLRGTVTGEQRNGGSFRDRINGVIGDIANSDPAYVDNLESRLPYVPTLNAASYSTYRTGLSARPEMVYAGTNAGLLHGVCAAKCPGAVGTELLAYVPSQVFPNLYKLTQPSYTHLYYVDGPTTVSDAYIDGAWKTILVGALGAGGKGVYALDVTNPTAFTAANVMWEFDPAKELAALPGSTDIGLTIGKPLVARVKAGDKSVAIFSNGFNGASGKASLLVVDLKTGALIRRLQVGGAATALAAPTALDVDSDGYVDQVYAGDDVGNVWRFDLTFASASDWAVAFGGTPFFSAPAGQPITSAPTLSAIDADDAVMLYVGTGRYLGNTDKANLAVQSFYAVRDKWVTASTGFTGFDTLKVTNLQQQTVVYEVEGATLAGGTISANPIRVTSANEVEYTTQHGWYINMLPPSGTPKGERINSSPALRHGRVIFTTLIPPVSSCEFGGSGWLMEMDAVSGKRFADSVLDLNDDGQIDAKDMYKYDADHKYSIGGRKFDELIRMPAFVGFGDKEGKYISGSSGSLTKVWEKGGATLIRGRLSWQQIE